MLIFSKPIASSVPMVYNLIIKVSDIFVQLRAEVNNFIKLLISRKSANVIIKGYCAESALCAR